MRISVTQPFRRLNPPPLTIHALLATITRLVMFTSELMNGRVLMMTMVMQTKIRLL